MCEEICTQSRTGVAYSGKLYPCRKFLVVTRAIMASLFGSDGEFYHSMLLSTYLVWFDLMG
jgi:hypothetical protein